MTFRHYRDESRRNWGTDGEATSLEQVNTGAILRIADAVEKMAERHTDLIRQRDYFEREVERLLAYKNYLERSNASLRGHLKRAKRMALTALTPNVPSDRLAEDKGE